MSFFLHTKLGDSRSCHLQLISFFAGNVLHQPVASHEETKVLFYKLAVNSLTELDPSAKMGCKQVMHVLVVVVFVVFLFFF